MKTYTATLTGVVPLLLHNGQLADPLNPATRALKEVTSRKKKTDEDTAEIRHLEWLGSMYLTESRKPCMPADNVLALIIAGAKKDKNGNEAKSGVMQAPGHELFELIYTGPRDLDALYADPRFVDCRSAKVNMSRVMRTRPIFRDWALQIALLFNEDVIDEHVIQQALEISGERVGLGDYRPRFGRFLVA
jgi:hypothetical protein